jgi:acetyl-CoA acetyltransferase
MAMPISNRVAIVGTGFSRIGRHLDASVGELALEAGRLAIEDAGLTFDDVDGISNYPNPSRLGAGNVDGVDLVSVNYMVRTAPLRNLRWSCSITQGTVTGSLVEAVHAVAAGACNYALVYRAMFSPPGAFGIADVRVATGDSQFTAPYGLSNTVMMWAVPYSRYMARYGATREHLATFIVNNRRNTNLNPEAVFYDKAIGRDDYLQSTMVADPLSMLDCDMAVDGCGAMIVTTAERARDLPGTPAYVTGCASIGVGYDNAPVLTLDSFMNSARILARTTWENSGLGPSDVDNLNLYDGFSYFPLLWLEAFGFCGEGEAFEFIQDGRTALGGTHPLNTSGGALGMGRLHGTPQLIEAVRQVQGRCGERQVEGCEVSLVQAGSPLHGSGALVLSKNA